ncbi:MAG: ABC transporter substrate-binding protein, partial [Candidatus Jordarchaeaceae archaeon]
MDSKKILAFSLALMTLLLVAGVLPISPVKAAGTKGPRTPYLYMKFYTLPEDCYAALKAGDIDLMLWPLTKDQYYDAIKDPSIILGPVSENGMYEMSFNGNETIQEYPGVISPTSQVDFRRALACLIDKFYIVNDICGGFATRMDMPVVVNALSWLNSSCAYPNYDWEYDPLHAATLLDNAGFVQGTTDNPYYDSGFPGSAQKIRVYPNYVHVHDNPHVGSDVTGPPYVWTTMLPAVGVSAVKGVKEGEHWYTDLAFTFDDVTDTITVTGVTLETCTYLWIDYLTPHPKAGLDLDPVIFYARSDHSLRLKAGEHLCANMRKAGIPVDFRALPSSGCYPPVMGERNYHIYTSGWRLGRYPVSMFGLYNSMWWAPWDSNYVNPPCPRPSPGPSSEDPNLDVATYDIYYTENLATAIVAAQKAQGIFESVVPTVPLWCAKSYFAWKNWLLGVCNMMGYGPENTYTFLNAYKAVGAPEPDRLRVGWNQPPQAVNILFSSWVYDYGILDRIFEGGQAINPYDLATDQAWIVQDWAVSTWMDGSVEKTKVTYWIRKDVYWVAPITGSVVRQFTVHDILFSNMFYYAFDDGWNWDNIMDIDHMNIVDNFCFEIYFVDKSFWFQYAGNYPYLPKNEWLTAQPAGATDPFCEFATYTEAGANYAAGEELMLIGEKFAQVVNVTVNGVALEEGVDYWVRSNSTGTYAYNRIRFNVPVSGNLAINYWRIIGDPHGYFPGSDTDWQTTTYSIGPYTLVEYISGDHALFLKNN